MKKNGKEWKGLESNWKDSLNGRRQLFPGGFHLLPPTPLRRLQKELPPDTIELILHGLKGELLLGRLGADQAN